ncbi:MAG: adenine deaminase, partial [Thermodesulfovibrionales bacterium]|nr:adenine deaminase [Thermodesulfovibrionales bacterium]
MIDREKLEQLEINEPLPLNRLSGNIVDIINKRIYVAQITINEGYIESISESPDTSSIYIIPPFIDAHVHVESSMLRPYEFARVSLANGVIASVSDPHEIANVLGIEGVKFMIEDGKLSPFRFSFGAPSCVPATNFDVSGGKINTTDIERLFEDYEITYLSEMMNFPGVINNFPDVIEKINIAHKYKKIIDGHAPKLRGPSLDKYLSAGISTDHETSSYDEGKEKLSKGMKLLIREGSSAKNLDALSPLINEFPDACMLCSDDLHPDDLINGSINLSVKRLLSKGFDIYNVLRCASYNTSIHYNIDIGYLQKGQSADFLIVDNIDSLNILATVIKGSIYAIRGKDLLQDTPVNIVNNFNCSPLEVKDLEVHAKSDVIKVIEAIDGQIITNKMVAKAKIKSGLIVSDTSNDILKLVLVNRYNKQKPAIAFVKNFGLKKGALGTSVSHDSHNILTVGVDD